MNEITKQGSRKRASKSGRPLVRPFTNQQLELLADEITLTVADPEAVKTVIAVLRYLQLAALGKITTDHRGKYVDTPKEVESELPDVIAGVILRRLTVNLVDDDEDAEMAIEDAGRAIASFGDFALDTLRNDIGKRKVLLRKLNGTRVNGSRRKVVKHG